MAQNVARQKEVTTREVASIRFGMYTDEEVRSISTFLAANTAEYCLPPVCPQRCFSRYTPDKQELAVQML